MLTLSIDARKKIVVIDFQYCSYLYTTVPLKLITELLCSYIDLHNRMLIWSVLVVADKYFYYMSQSEV